MIIGVAREIMDNECRVGLVPAGVQTLVGAGHRVVVERGAGNGCGIGDADFIRAGATIAPSPAEVFDQSEMIIKVKEPLEVEFDLFQKGQALFTFLHLAPRMTLTDFLCRRGVTALAYETVQLADGSLPILAPMSEVAGRMSIQIGAHYLEKQHGGAGVLLGGVPGVEHGRITVIGAGSAGSNAVRIAQAMGAEVTVLDINLKRLEYLDELYQGRVRTLVSNEQNVGATVEESDLVIGAVLVPGSAAPVVITRDMVSQMRPGSVIVDIAIDQGGCVETATMTTHSDPVFTREGVIHYCVANIPGCVPRTSTYALTNVTLPFILALAEKGISQAMEEDGALRKGLNISQGVVVNQEVARAQDRPWIDPFPEQEM